MLRSKQSRCRRMAKFWWAAISTSIGGQARNNIARLDATTGLADSFNPNPNDPVLCNRGAGGRQDSGGRRASPPSADSRATGSPGSMPQPAWPIRSTRTRTVTSMPIAVQADGKILAGGYFTSIGGQTRNRIARLDAATGLADSFNPNANGVVKPIAVQADGKILVGGDFTQYRRTAAQRYRPARCHRPAWLIRSTRMRTDLSTSIAVQADGKILVGGVLHEHRRTGAKGARPARCYDRLG